MQALAAFEEQFTYPLGPGRVFRISHGSDYARFFRALGEGACFVAEEGGRVLGTLGVALRRLRLPDGGEAPAAYLGDLKLTPAARHGSTLRALISSASAWDVPRPDIIFGVVMEGTPYTPPAPAVARVVVFRLATGGASAAAVHSTTPAIAAECYARWSRGRYATPAGAAAERSSLRPVPLVLTDGSACGTLEDTQRAKLLIADDGAEMTSAHLSDFAYQTPADGAELVAGALRVAGRFGIPHLFVAVCAQDAYAFRDHFGPLVGTEAGATIYGIGLEPGLAWNINTAEI